MPRPPAIEQTRQPSSGRRHVRSAGRMLEAVTAVQLPGPARERRGWRCRLPAAADFLCQNSAYPCHSQRIARRSTGRTVFRQKPPPPCRTHPVLLSESAGGGRRPAGTRGGRRGRVSPSRGRVAVRSESSDPTLHLSWSGLGAVRAGGPGPAECRRGPL